MSAHKDCDATVDHLNTEIATLRARVAELEKVLEEIAAKECTGIGSPPGCACRTCVARAALTQKDAEIEAAAKQYTALRAEHMETLGSLGRAHGEIERLKAMTGGLRADAIRDCMDKLAEVRVAAPKRVAELKSRLRKLDMDDVYDDALCDGQTALMDVLTALTPTQGTPPREEPPKCVVTASGHVVIDEPHEMEDWSQPADAPTPTCGRKRACIGCPDCKRPTPAKPWDGYTRKTKCCGHPLTEHSKLGCLSECPCEVGVDFIEFVEPEGAREKAHRPWCADHWACECPLKSEPSGAGEAEE